MALPKVEDIHTLQLFGFLAPETCSLQNNSWTLVVQKIEVLEQPLKWLVEVNYLFDAAPHHLLTEGAEFELFEGKQCVVRGRIID